MPASTDNYTAVWGKKKGAGDREQRVVFYDSGFFK
jgi:hypothetical protein